MEAVQRRPRSDVRRGEGAHRSCDALLPAPDHTSVGGPGAGLARQVRGQLRREDAAARHRRERVHLREDAELVQAAQRA
jgi:hypothetical protein